MRNLAVVLAVVLLAATAATASASVCAIKFVYPSSPASTGDLQRSSVSSPLLFVKPTTHDESVNFVVRFTGSITEATAPSSVFAIFEIFSGGPELSPQRFWKQPLTLKTGSMLDHTVYIDVPFEALRSYSYATAAASVYMSMNNGSTLQDINLCHREVRIFLEESDARSSISDNGAYPLFCEEAANDAHVFAHFKSHPDYSQIVTSLDHREALVHFVPLIRRQAKEDEIRHVIELVDTIGGPLMLDLGGFVANPSTLRYIATALSLFARFGPTANMSIVELGGGFGGQAIALAAMKMGGFTNYVDIDMAESCLLATQHIQLTRALPATSFLERDVLGRFLCITSKMWNPQTACDMFISNYALSELSAAVQKQIIQDVVASCKRGHIQANDISTHHGLAGSSTAELVKALQDNGLQLVLRSEFMEQKKLPVTIIEWGCTEPGCNDDFE